MSNIKLGIIGGSGLYAIEGMTDIRRQKVETPFGSPSNEFIIGKLDGLEVAFLPRHGEGHVFNPSEINYRANIYGMKSLGVEKIISVSAVGSLKEEIKPGSVVFIDQFIDRTKSIRKSTFFEKGMVAHVSCADPICNDLSKILSVSATEEGIKFFKGGTYVCMEGPQFSTRAESHLYRAWGASVIGMTNHTESQLSREAQICYATIAIATDYDCWREGEEVDIHDLLNILKSGTELAKKIIKKTVPKIYNKNLDCKCRTSLKTAVFTHESHLTNESKVKLDILFR